MSAIFACAKIDAGLVIECAVTILTLIPLKGSVAAVLDHRLRPAARALTTVAPADLLEQVRGAPLRDELVEWEHFVRVTQRRHPCPLRFHSASSPEQQSLSQERFVYIKYLGETSTDGECSILRLRGAAGRMTLCNSTLPEIRRLLHKAIMQRRGPFSTLTCRSCRSSCGEKSSRGVVDSWTGSHNWCAGGAGERCAPAGDRRRHLTEPATPRHRNASFRGAHFRSISPVRTSAKPTQQTISLIGWKSVHVPPRSY